MDYNTQREKLILPEYGRNVQKMLAQVAKIEDRDKRAQQMAAVMQVMCTLNPQVREQGDFRHKLWDHAQIISNFSIDVDSPYPMPTRQQLDERPEPLEINRKPIKAACYGRNIENMIALISDIKEEEARKELIRLLAIYMRQQYLIWNKDNVSEETIFADMEKLSEGRIKVPEDVHIGAVAHNAVFNRPSLGMGGLGSGMGGGQNRGGGFKKKGGKNRKR